ATMCHHEFTHLVLVNAMGIQPTRGEIIDQFLISTLDYVRAGFADQNQFAELYKERPDVDQLVTWEVNREMTTRIALEALHVQPGDAPSDQGGDGADAGGMGQEQPGGAAVMRR